MQHRHGRPERGRASSPPRWAQLLVSLSASSREREHILGDLEEEYRRLERRHGRSFAAAWYRRQAANSLSPNLRARRSLILAQPGASQSPGKSSLYRRSLPRRILETTLDLPMKFLLDLRLAARLMVRRPLPAILMITTLALGLGASMTIWSVVRGVLVRPLPYEAPQQLTSVWTVLSEKDTRRGKLSGPELASLWERSQLYDGLAGIWTRFGSLSDGKGGPEQIHIGWITGNFFDVLGARPLLGRTFRSDEDKENGPPVLVLSHSVWQRRYGGDLEIVGRSVQFNGESFTVVGVMPQDFEILMPNDAGLSDNFGAWLPWQNDYAAMDPGWRLWSVVGRVQTGVDPAAAQSELSTIADQLRSEVAQYEETGLDFQVVPLHADVVAGVRPGVLAAFGATGLLLLIACANVANLILLQAGRRQRELALRSALGASRGRILRQLTSENLLLFFLSGLLGALVARLGVGLLFLLEPPDLPRLAEVQLDWTAYGGAFALMLLAGLLFGTLPIFKITNRQTADLRSGSHPSGDARRGSRSALVAIEVALAVVLLVGAGLLFRSFSNLSQVDTGFESSDSLSFQLSLPFTRFPYEQPAPISTFYENLLDSLADLQGVESVAVTEGLPMTGLGGNPEPYSLRTRDGEIEWGTRFADYRAVSAGFFQALGIEKLSGRFFDDRDDLGRPTVAIIDQQLARANWPGEDAVGKKIKAGVFVGGETVPVWAEIVGVVEHVRYLGLETVGREQIYLHHRQSPRRSMTVVMATPLAADTLIPQVKQALHAIDPERPLFNVRTLDEVVAGATAETRFLLNLLSVFAALAGILAAVGIYGVLAQLVAQSTREIGVRRACGALGRQIVWLVVGRGLMLAGFGIAIGVALALAGVRLLRNLVFGVTVYDPATFVAAAVAVIALAAVACWVPARRASRVDPMTALRAD